MCITPCNDPRCALYNGPVIHEGVCNPSSSLPMVQLAECCNTELSRQINNIATGPIHIRAFNFCPPRMTSAEAGIYDPPQPRICFWASLDITLWIIEWKLRNQTINFSKHTLFLMKAEFFLTAMSKRNFLTNTLINLLACIFVSHATEQ